MRSKIQSLVSIIRLAGLAIAALAMWGFVAIAEEVLEKETYNFDSSILLALRNLHTPLLDRIMFGFTCLGEPNLLLAMCVTLGILLLLRQKILSALLYLEKNLILGDV
jgi:hypothetical protein